MVDYMSLISSQLGISVWFLFVIIVWEVVWKLFAMWKSARNNSVAWFIVLAALNTAGILPILYIYVFSKLTGKRNSKKTKKNK